jgi:hypothetical protein
LEEKLLKDCVKAISIAINRFDTATNNNKFHSAQDIEDYLNTLSNTVSFRFDIKHLKLALANFEIRKALLKLFPGEIAYDDFSRKGDIIRDGEYKFNRGYRIKFLKKSSQVTFKSTDIDSIRKGIVILSDKILSILPSPNMKMRRMQPLSSSPETLVGDSELLEGNSSGDQNEGYETEGYETIDISDGVKKNRKRGRGKGLNNYSKREHNSAKERKALLRRVKNLERKAFPISKFETEREQTEAEFEIKKMSLELKALIDTAGSYVHDNINGKPCMSIASGIILQDMISNSGCSVEKLPLIIAQVLSLLFGKLDKSVLATILRSHRTYALASERSSALVTTLIKNRFVDRTLANRIDYAYLILDASNKKGKGCVGKIVFVVGPDGVVRQIALRLDTTVTKKAIGSSKLTIESLVQELGSGIVYIMGITTDAFGAAIEEAILVLQYIDKIGAFINFHSFIYSYTFF